MTRQIIKWAACVAVIIAVSAAFFWPDAFVGNTLQQHDMQQGAANGQELVEHLRATGQKTWWTNSLFSGMPAFQISPGYRSSGMMSWITKLYGGFLPNPANLLCMMMLGMLFLLGVMRCRPGLALIGAIAWGFSSYFVIIIGAGHLWKFITLAYVPPTIAGLWLIYNGRRLAGTAIAALAMALQLQSNHVQMTYYFAWVMAALVIAMLVKAVKDKAVKRWGLDTGCLAAAMLLAVAANLPSLYHTYEYSKQTIRGCHSDLTAATTADRTTGGLDRDYITAYSYEKGETFSLLIPNIKGGASARPVKGGMAPADLTSLPEGREMARQGQQMVLLQLFSQYFGGPEGTNGPVYVGALVMALFVFGCVVVRGPVKWALLAMTLLSVLLAWGRHFMWFTDLFIDFMPGYSKFRTVESILVIAEFCIPLLAVLGLRQLMLSPKPWQEYRKPLLWSFGFCMAICFMALVAPSAFGPMVMGEKDRQTIDMYMAYGMLPADFDIMQYPAVLAAVEQLRASLVKADALRSLLFIAAGGGIIMLWARGKVKGTWCLAIVGALVAADLYTADKRYVSSESFVAPSSTGMAFTPSPADRAVLADTTYYRVLDVPQFQQAAPSYFHKSIGGYHAAKLTRYQDLIDRHLAYVARPEVTQLLEIRNDSVAALYPEDDVKWLRSHLNVLDMLNTRYIITDPQLAPTVNVSALGNAWLVDTLLTVSGADAEMDALEQINPAGQAVADRQYAAVLDGFAAPVPGDTISLVSYAPDRLEYRCDTQGPRLAVFSEVFFPWGWHATLDDGEELPIGRVDYLLRAVKLPAGSHRLTMTFKPRSIAVTDNVAAAAIILIYLLGALAIVKCWASGTSKGK